VVRPRVGISRCLLGDAVRYDGGHKLESMLIEVLGRHVDWVPVCPEVEVGMGTPREPIELVAASGGVRSSEHRVRLVGTQSGRDWTDDMDRWRRERVAELGEARLSGFVLKSKSPSCGVDGVQVRTDKGTERAGRGLFAEALIEAMPHLPIEDEQRLRDAEVCDAFLERVFAYERAHRTTA
jgi:uncharacterized protein YbbK (DUF523 family)